MSKLNNTRKRKFSNGVKALALISGGLDSALAVKIMSGQGVEVVGVSFLTPFHGDDFGKRVKSLAEQLNIDLKLADISEDFLEMLKSPLHGYGKNLNPCIDCRILEFKKAHELMKELGANFIVTGEVLGQRPMSQNKRAIKIIEKEIDFAGLIVRPLCGKLLAATTAEKKGWIDRNKLLDINGRSRKRQYELAKQLNVSGYGAPAGGCLLTDPGFSLIVKNLLQSDMLDISSIDLIKTGRYFSIDNSFKLVVGRNNEENLKLMELAKGRDMIFQPQSKGPVAIGIGNGGDESLKIACKIVAYYCKPARADIKVSYNGNEKVINSGKISEQELKSYRA